MKYEVKCEVLIYLYAYVYFMLLAFASMPFLKKTQQQHLIALKSLRTAFCQSIRH